MAFKSVVAITFNKFKYRYKQLNILSPCINTPKNLPTEIFYYQLFSFHLLYIMLMILNCVGSYFILFPNSRQ